MARAAAGSRRGEDRRLASALRWLVDASVWHESVFRSASVPLRGGSSAALTRNTTVIWGATSRAPCSRASTVARDCPPLTHCAVRRQRPVKLRRLRPRASQRRRSVTATTSWHCASLFPSCRWSRRCCGAKRGGFAQRKRSNAPLTARHSARRATSSTRCSNRRRGSTQTPRTASHLPSKQ